MDSKTRLLYWLLGGSRGGPTRLHILRILQKKPMNMRQLSLLLGMDYKTVQGHIELLMENGIVETPEKRYGSVYFIGWQWAENPYLTQLIRGDPDGKTGKQK